jgi:hypothetical protein
LSDLFRFIDRQRLAVLATVSPSQTPESALVGYAITQDLEIIFDTLNTTRKYANLMANPHISFVFSEGEITIQYEGIAEVPHGEKLTYAQAAYFQKWPDGPDRQNWPGMTYFLVTPKWIRYSDYNQRPPLFVETQY